MATDALYLYHSDAQVLEFGASPKCMKWIFRYLFRQYSVTFNLSKDIFCLPQIFCNFCRRGGVKCYICQRMFQSETEKSSCLLLYWAMGMHLSCDSLNSALYNSAGYDFFWRSSYWPEMSMIKPYFYEPFKAIIKLRIESHVACIDFCYSGV